MDNFSALLGKKLAGSGGGSGTSNYNELENKPQINGNTLSGNKAAANLGLQSVINQNNKLDADLLDDSESEKKLVSENDISNWNNKYDSDDAYTKAQTDAAITGAISALDVTETGGSGKYISAISETNGKIAATPTTFDTALSSSSTNNNAPTTKAVYDDQQRQEVEIGDIANKEQQNENNISYNQLMGVKNMAKPYGTSGTNNNVTYTYNADDTITVKSDSATHNQSSKRVATFTAPYAGKFLINGIPKGASNTSFFLNITGYGGVNRNITGDDEVNPTTAGYVYYIDIYVRANIEIDTTFSIMFRPASISDDTYQPYAPSNRELYEMIQALQSGGASTQSVQPALMPAAKPMIDAEEVSEKEAEPDEVLEIEENEGAEER